MSEEQGRYVTHEEMDSTVTGQNMRLGHFVIPKFGSDIIAEVRGHADGTMGFFIADGHLKVAVFSTDLGGWTVIGEESKGTIKGYVGLAADIQPGWYLCDGNNDTYDLRGYFILGSELSEAGVATDAQALAITDHGIITSSSPSASKTVAAGAGETVPTPDHAHTTNVAGHTVTTAPTPASFTLAFIQKVS